jgi:hypothetical protein
MIISEERATRLRLTQKLGELALYHFSKLPHRKKVSILRWIVCYEGFWETVRFNRTIEGNEHEIAIKIYSQ